MDFRCSRSEKHVGRRINVTLVYTAILVQQMGIPDPDVPGFSLSAPLPKLVHIPHFLHIYVIIGVNVPLNNLLLF